jgi:hypothetical protein
VALAYLEMAMAAVEPEALQRASLAIKDALPWGEAAPLLRTLRVLADGKRAGAFDFEEEPC